MNSPVINSCIEVATKAHIEAITEIYRLAQIKPEVFIDIADLRPGQSAPLRSILKLGGFINPPDRRDMEMTLEHGLVLVCIQNGEVAGYNRIITGASEVYGEFCRELLTDQAPAEFEHHHFTDWSGNMQTKPGKFLQRVHWVDRDQALLALNAAVAGLLKKPSGKLAWAVDAAVHPAYRRRGVSKALIKRLNSSLKPEFQFRVFRIFEILEINGTDIKFSNVRSEKTFIDPTSRQFACTEETLVLNDSLTLRVRWNFWLRHL
jgi:hypothetical protein